MGVKIKGSDRCLSRNRLEKRDCPNGCKNYRSQNRNILKISLILGLNYWSHFVLVGRLVVVDIICCLVVVESIGCLVVIGDICCLVVVDIIGCLVVDIGLGRVVGGGGIGRLVEGKYLGVVIDGHFGQRHWG